MLPTEPLLKHIAAAAQAVKSSMSGDVGGNEISKRIAFRLDKNWRHVHRQICRMQSGDTKRIGFETADEYAIALGLHPMLIWDEWTSFVEVA